MCRKWANAGPVPDLLQLTAGSWRYKDTISPIVLCCLGLNNYIVSTLDIAEYKTEWQNTF